MLHHPPANKSTQKSNYQQSRKSCCQENHEDVPPKNQKQKARYRKRITQFEVGEFLVKNNIHQDTDLFYEANKTKEDTQTDLAAFLLSRSSKALNDLIENTWEMQNAKASMEHEKQLEWSY